MTINVNNRAYPAAQAGPGVITSIWMLLLAMLFKAVITVFTFGMKVILTREIFYKILFCSVTSFTLRFVLNTILIQFRFFLFSVQNTSLYLIFLEPSVNNIVLL